MFRLVPLTLLAAGVAVAAPVPKDLKKKADLSGTWEITEMFSAGNKVNGAAPNKWVIDAAGGLTIERANVNGAVAIRQPVNRPTYTLVKPDGGAENALDYTITYPAGNSRSYQGVVEVDGDTLRYFYATSNPNGGAVVERPTEVKAHTSGVLYVFKRVEGGK